MELHSFTDLRRTVARWSEDIFVECYNLPYDELIEAVSDDFLTYLRDEHEFKWGDDLPYISGEQFWDFFRPYDREVK